MAKSDLDFYQILGVTRHSSDDEIKKAFRKLARDTHPDKNPNDPTAKERFQNVQHAYDTLKDTLERSKYDNDNPSHGYGGSHGASRGTPGTRTAKRYANTTPSSHSHTPGWKTGTTWTDGYAERAAGSTPSRPTRAGAGFYEYTEAPEHTQTKRTPRNPYSAYTSRTYEDAHSAKPRESAYARANKGPTAGHQPRPKSTAGQHNSTSARYATGSGGSSTPTPQADFDLGSYIRERRAKEFAQQQQEEERRRAERESSGSGSDRRKHATAERERERAREDNRKAESESRTKYSSKPGPYGYDHTPGSFPADDDPEELMKEADRQMKDGVKDGQRKSTRHSASYPSGKQKPSPRPTFERTASASASSYYPSLNPDFNVYEANPDNDSDDDKPAFTSMPRKTDYSKQPRADYFSTQWPSEGFGFGNFQPSAGPKKTTFDNVNVHHATPPQSPGGQKMKDATPPRRTRSMGASAAKKAAEVPEPPKFNFSTIDPFAFQEPPTDTDSTPRRPATTVNHDFKFNPGIFGQTSPRFGSGPFTTRNSPEPPKKYDGADEPPLERPRSQPNVASPKVEIPLRGGPPPQPKKQTPRPVKKELWENLLNTTSAYEYQASEGSNAARKKRSVPALKKKKPERRASADDKNRRADSDSEDDNPIKGSERMEGPFYHPTTSAAPTASSAVPPPQHSTAANLGPEPMDTTPDFTDSPKPQSQPQPQVHIPEVFTNLGGFKPDGTATAGPFPNGFKPTPTTGIDLSNLGAVPPLAPNPTEAGLGGFGDLKNNLPFQSRASDKPPIKRTPSNASSNTKPKVRMAPPPPSTGGLSSFMDQFPPTPHDEDGPLEIPTPPRAIKVPSIVSLKAYNETYEALGKYFADWQEYEKKVSSLRTQLDIQHTIQLEKNVSGQFISPRADAIEAYLRRLTERDAKLDESFRKAKKEHIKMLKQWMLCREQVIHMREGEDGVMGSQGRPGEEGYRGAAPVGYKR